MAKNHLSETDQDFLVPKDPEEKFNQEFNDFKFGGEGTTRDPTFEDYERIYKPPEPYPNGPASVEPPYFKVPSFAPRCKVPKF